GGTAIERLGDERALQVRLAAAHQVAVEHVVVHQQRRVQQLEGGSGGDGAVGFPAPEGGGGAQEQLGADPLAAADRVADPRPEPPVCVARRFRTFDALGEQRLEALVDVGQALPVGDDHGCASRAGKGANSGTEANSGATRLRSSSCSTSQGLNAHGVARAAARRSAVRTQVRSMTSSGFASGSLTAVAMYTGQISFSTMPEASMAR